jgi:phage FluMu protein Com
MEVVGEVYIHEMEVLHDSCRECSKILPRAYGSMHVSDHVTVSAIAGPGGEAMICPTCRVLVCIKATRTRTLIGGGATLPQMLNCGY